MKTHLNEPCIHCYNKSNKIPAKWRKKWFQNVILFQIHRSHFKKKFTGYISKRNSQATFQIETHRIHLKKTFTGYCDKKEIHFLQKKPRKNGFKMLYYFKFTCHISKRNSQVTFQKEIHSQQFKQKFTGYISKINSRVTFQI